MVPQSWKDLYSENNLRKQGLQFIRARNKMKKEEKNDFLNNKSTGGDGGFVVKSIILIIIVKDFR